MSTKTLRKRIALVVVSAVGFGVMSAVAANASTGITIDTAVISTTASVTGKGGPSVASPYDNTVGTSFGLVYASTDTVTAGSTATGTMLSTGQVSFLTRGTSATGIVVTGGIIGDSAGTISGISSDGTKAYIGSNADGAVMVKNNGTAAGGVVLVQFFSGSGISSTSTASNGTLIGQFALTVASSGASNAISVSKSNYSVDTAYPFTATVDQAAGFTVVNGGVGYIAVAPKDAYGVALSGSSHAFNVSATNGALVGFSAYPSKTSAVTTSVPTGIYITQPTANAPVSTTVTFTVDGVTLGDKSLTFLGDLAKIVATPLGNAKKGGTDNQVVSFKAYDAAGNRVLVSLVSVKGTNAVISSGAQDTQTTTTQTGVVGLSAADYGTNAGLYLQATNAAGTDIKSNVFSISSGGDAYTYTAKLDKSTYHMGDVATLTITTKDSKGNLANDITALGSSTLKPSIGGGGLTAVNAPLYTDVTTNGVITYQYIIGNTAGTFSAAVDLPLLTSASGNASDTTKTVSWTVSSDGSVSNADVLSAIVKLIASINKQIAALQKSLKK